MAYVSPFQVVFNSRSMHLAKALPLPSAGLVSALTRSCFSWDAGEQLQQLPQKTWRAF